jgi:hypothetical protein
MLDKVKIIAKDKCTILLVCNISDEQKCTSLTPGVKVRKLYYSAVAKRPNKLECLSLASLSKARILP